MPTYTPPIPDTNKPSQRRIDEHAWREPWGAFRIVIVVLVIVIPLGLIWVSWQRPWLINDYRDGYHHGSLSHGEFRTDCARSAQRHYPEAFNPRGTPFTAWNPEVRAFTVGCQDATFGLSNAWWHLDSRLSRGSDDGSDGGSD